MKSSEFAKSFAKKQAVERAKAKLFAKGQRLYMYENQLEVCSDEHTAEVILKDQYGNKIHMPRNRLESFVKCGLASYSPLEKAEGYKPAPKPHPGQDQHEMKGSGVHERGVPVGTIHNGRQKVSSNPSKWVDLATGHHYDDHKDSKAKTISSPETQAAMKTVVDKITPSISPADKSEVEHHLANFIEAKTQYHNLMSAANRESKRDPSGVAGRQKDVFKKADEAKKAKEKFIEVVKAAQERKKSSGQES